LHDDSKEFDRSSVADLRLADMPNTPRITPRPRRVEILAFADAQLLDITGPMQVFASANDLAGKDGRPPYQIRMVAQSSPVVTNSGLALLADPLPAVASVLDTLIVAGGWGVQAACENRILVRWLERRAARARRVVSVCTGAFLLGAAGLLEGRRAVTHWGECQALASRHPGAQVLVDPIFVRDGELWTSAGVTAGIDLALALIEDDLGHSAAMAVARELVVFLKRSGGQAQFSHALQLQRDTQFEALHAWMSLHLTKDLSVTALAERSAMSERTFLRRYRAATGVSPARAVERLRVEAAQRYLLDSKVPVKRIAERCGFGCEETMRQSFQRVLAVAPRDFRARFSSKPDLVVS
jgi:transcriptional regulator GlxA family with amidase domain